MSLTIEKIEKEFDYLTMAEIANDTTFPKLRGGIMLTDMVFERFSRLAKKLDVKESAVLSELMKRFSVKHFQNNETVSRAVYQATVDENTALENQVAELVKIVEHLQANNPANVLANQPANGSANGSANAYADGHAYRSANGYADGYANGYAQNPAVSANIPAKEQMLNELMPIFLHYLKTIAIDVNPQHLYAWIRQYIR